ncbi:hypothetical protein VPH35_053956 [Triticum aestivum]
MEPKRSSPQAQPQPRAATKKSPPRAAAADAAIADSPLSSLFHPAPHGVNGKEQDLYAILFKGQNGNAQASMTDGKSQWSPARGRTTYTKDINNPRNTVITRWIRRILSQILMAIGGKARFTTKQELGVLSLFEQGNRRGEVWNLISLIAVIYLT